jgi:tetratricopeptide (TPR) repeat protein
MSRKFFAGLIIALVAAAATVFYVINSREDEPFRPPMENTEAESALAQLMVGDPELQTIHSWVELSPEDSSARAAFGSALLSRGFYANAKEHLTIAVNLDPNNAGAHRDLGTALNKLEETDAAIRHWQEAVRINPNDPAARNNLANGYFGKNMVKEATEEWQKAVNLDPDFAPTRVNLGYAFLAGDSVDAALEQLRLAVSLDPALPSAYYTLATLWGMEANADSSIYYLEKGLELAPEDFRQIIGQPAFNLAKADPRFKGLLQKHATLMHQRGIPIGN